MQGAFKLIGVRFLYKLIAFDLDGTLLDDNKKIPKENLEIINKLIKDGFEIVIATGRRYWSAKELTKEIEGPITIIANNGNIVRSSKNDELIAAKYLDLESYKLIIEEGRKRDLHPIVHIDDYDKGIDLIVEANREYDDYIKKANRYMEVDSYLDIKNPNILVVVYADSKEKLYPFYEYIKSNYPNSYNIHIMENLKLVESMVEIMNPLGSKWITLKEYAESLNIKEEEIIAIGDDNNDIEMVKNAGFGIAMKNGSSGVKEVAKMITENDNNNSGVAYALKRVLNI